MSVEKITVTWSGFSGSPGYSNFYWTAGQASVMQPKIKTFFDAIKANFPTAIAFAVPDNGMILDEATGKTTGTWQQGTAGSTNGTAAGAWASTSGALIRWETGRFQRGKRVRGRTFLVPIVSSAYSSGTISTATANAINGYADALRTGGSLQVWSRPIIDRTDPQNPILKTPGALYPVTSNTTPTKVVVLTRRRD